MTGSGLFNYELYYNGLMTDLGLTRVLFEKGKYLCLEQYLFIAQQNKNHLRVHTFSDNTGIG